MSRLMLLAPLLACLCMSPMVLAQQPTPAPAAAPSIDTATGLLARLLDPAYERGVVDELYAATWSVRRTRSLGRLNAQLKRSDNDIQDLEILYSRDKLHRPTAIKYSRFVTPAAGAEALAALERDFKAVCDMLDKHWGRKSLRSGTGPVLTCAWRDGDSPPFTTVELVPPGDDSEDPAALVVNMDLTTPRPAK